MFKRNIIINLNFLVMEKAKISQTSFDKGNTSPQEWAKKITNAEFLVKSNKLELIFPEQGIMKPEKNKFSDLNELFTFLVKRFKPNISEKVPGGVIKRRGKYQRVDMKDNPIFTFGDPILDLITDEEGIIVVGTKKYDLRVMELSQPDARGGGNLLIDFSFIAQELSRHQLYQASLGGEKFTVESCSESNITIASSNPSKLWFYQPGTNRKMRFRVFKKNYFLYWKMGCDIETWGQNFSSASITSSYGEFLGSVCFTIKTDSDSDTNDDYVDEYEWGTFGTPKPDGVRSNCVANWGGRVYSGVVSSGCTVIDF